MAPKTCVVDFDAEGWTYSATRADAQGIGGIPEDLESQTSPASFDHISDQDGSYQSA